MLIHASCAAHSGHGVLLLGPSGAGKSDLLLRLLDRGFTLVADDQVDIDGQIASAPTALAGLLEVRGIGIVRLPFEPSVTLALAVELARADRLPRPARHPIGVPLVAVDPGGPSAPDRVQLALRCATGQLKQLSGAFAA